MRQYPFYSKGIALVPVGILTPRSREVVSRCKSRIIRRNHTLPSCPWPIPTSDQSTVLKGDQGRSLNS